MNALVLRLFFSVVLSFLMSFYLIPFFCSLARKLNFVDVPDGGIKNHKQPTPYLGGLAVYCGFLFTLAVTYPFENNLFLFLVGSTLLLFIGLIDDFLVLKPYQKFFGHMVAALCFLKGGFYLKTHFFNNYWALPISYLWILSMINAFNLVDVMDGLASLLALIASVSFFCIAAYFGHHTVMLLLACFIGALLAFFWYNKPEAQIYLGDAGSLFIGGFLATVPFLFDWGLYNIHGFLAPTIILAIPLLEVAFLVVIRTYKGIPFYQGSPHHFSIYLQKKGWPKEKVLWYIFFCGIILGCAAWLFATGTIELGEMIFLVGVFIVAWLLVFLSGGKK